MNFRNSGKMPLILVREFGNLVIEKSVKSQGILRFMICGNPENPQIFYFNFSLQKLSSHKKRLK